MKVAASRIMPLPDLSMPRVLITCGILHAVVCASSFGRLRFVMIPNASMGMRRVIRLVLDEFETVERS